MSQGVWLQQTQVRRSRVMIDGLSILHLNKRQGMLRSGYRQDTIPRSGSINAANAVIRDLIFWTVVGVIALLSLPPELPPGDGPISGR